MSIISCSVHYVTAYRHILTQMQCSIVYTLSYDNNNAFYSHLRSWLEVAEQLAHTLPWSSHSHSLWKCRESHPPHTSYLLCRCLGCKGWYSGSSCHMAFLRCLQYLRRIGHCIYLHWPHIQDSRLHWGSVDSVLFHRDCPGTLEEEGRNVHSSVQGQSWPAPRESVGE